MKTIYSSEEEAIRDGLTVSAYQEQQQALTRSNKPKEFEESLARLEEAQQALAAAEEEAARKAALVHEWDRLLERRSNLEKRLSQAQGMLDGYKAGTKRLREWVDGNTGCAFVPPAQVNEAFTGLAVNETAERILPEIIAKIRGELESAIDSVERFAKKHGLEHL